MDLLPTNILPMIILSFKIVMIIGACAIVAINYFHTKEAKKMERKLSVAFPGSVNLAMSLQMFVSAAFLVSSIVLLFIY